MRVDVIDIQIPRGILDIGRISPDSAVRNIFDKNKYPKILKYLQNLHQKTLEQIFDYFQNLSDTGFWIDLHTMAPFNPKSAKYGPDPVALAPNNISGYLDSYISPFHWGEPRVINVATSTIEKPGVDISDPTLTKNIESSLQENDFEFGRNNPHPMTSNITAAKLMQKFGRGLLIDIPKNSISSGDRKKVASNLHDLQTDKEKLTKMARAIVSGLIYYYKFD